LSNFKSGNKMKKIRAKTKDVAFKYRMGAGYPGDVTRTHPVDIYPELADATTPPDLAGQAVMVDATSHRIRKVTNAAEGVTGSISLYGITVRTFPFQQATTSTNFGAVAIGGGPLPVSGEVDVLRRGGILVSVPAGQTPVKGGTVYIWNVATSGAHIQGGFEAVDGTTNTIDVANAVWNSGVDANGVAELIFNN
jgi:hypothetical protein